MKNLMTVAAFFCFTYSFVSIAATTVSCETLFISQSAASPLKGLMSLGFNPQVAKKIARVLPELAEKLLIIQPQEARAITLYRGLGVSPENVAFETEYYDKSAFWFSLDADTAFSFAKSSRKPVGTVIEVQVPAYFFESSYDSSIRDPEKLIAMGFTDGTISRYHILDLKPFVRRIGVVNNKKNSNSIQWQRLKKNTAGDDR